MATINLLGSPTVLPPTAEEQRRQISNYQSSSGAGKNTGQAFVNATNTSVLSAISQFDPGVQQTVSKEDQARTNTTQTQQQTVATGNIDALGLITPQPNILDQFASTVWSASVYLLSPAQYTELVRSKQRSVNGYNLLFQTGGAGVNVGGRQGRGSPVGQAPGNNAPDAGRNPAFGQDFYIDSVEFENLLPGKSTQAAHSVSRLKFTVVEPGSITLLDRMYAAVQDMAQALDETGAVNYTATQYLMVMRWYGYDINGNLIEARNAADDRGVSDTKAIVEKFIPFLIRKIDWSVSSRLVTYEFECAPVGQSVAGGTNRGTVPYDVQLSAQTVQELLSGDTVYASLSSSQQQDPSGRRTAATDPRSFTAVNVAETPRAAAPATQAAVRAVDNAIAANGTPPTKTNAAPTNKTTLKSGLASAMTKFAQDHVDVKKAYTKADTYTVIFDASAKEIADATIVLPGAKINQAATPMGVSASVNANQALSPAANGMDIKAQNYSITAGMQMVQAIDLAIRNSSYIWNQGLYIIDKYGKQVPNPNAGQNKPIKWYKINLQATPGQYDKARNDFAYNITYVISAYEIPNFDSKYFPLGKFRGVHKRYPYWFTGENTAVLDFTANFNAAYNMTISGGPDQESADAQLRRRLTSNTKDIIKYSYAPRSSETAQGGPVKGTEQQSNAAEYLYAIDQPGGSELRIIGDPAWIQQGSLVGGVTPEDFSTSAFGPDGTINFDSSQVLFEIAWQRPEDYDLGTGVANPYARPGNTPGQPQQTNVYQATRVVSEFRGGRFEQVITGLLYYIPVPNNHSNPVTLQPTAGGGQSTAQFAATDERRLDLNRTPDTYFAPRDSLGTGVRADALTAGLAVARSAAAVVTGTKPAPIFSTPDYSAAAISGTASPAVLIQNTVGLQNPPEPASGGGVTLGTVADTAPVSLRGAAVINAAALRPPQVMAKDF